MDALTTKLTPPSRYPVVVRQVQEVSLYGTADLAFWRRQLAPEGLSPYDNGGRAELLIIAAAMTWLGVPFSELSISISIGEDPAANQRAAMYLIQAFNSIRPFAWVERTFFQTPYEHGQTRLAARFPACVTLSDGQAAVFRAVMSAQTACRWRGDEVWEGGIFLPGRLTRTSQAEKLFFARLSGLTEIYPFSPTLDSVELIPSGRARVIDWLAGSGFTGREWHIRAAATHEKSLTYARREVTTGRPAEAR